MTYKKVRSWMLLDAPLVSLTRALSAGDEV